MGIEPFRFILGVGFVIGKARGLTLEINWKSDYDWEHWYPLYNIALNCVALEVSDLTLDLDRVDMAHALQYKRISPDPHGISAWPRLEKLKLHSQERWNAMLDSFDATMADMPRLVDLSLVNISVRNLAPYQTPSQVVEPMFPWWQLVRLQLTKPDLIIDIALVLLQCYALEGCSLYVKPTSRQMIPAAEIDLPNLRRLAVCGTEGDFDGRLFDLFNLPALQSLSLRHLGGRTLEYRSVINMLDRSNCSVEELCLSEVEMSEKQYACLLQKMPTLKDLTIVHFDESKTWVKFLKHGAQRKCGYLPELQRIKIGLGPVNHRRQTWTELESWFNRMVEVRTRVPVCHPTVEGCRCSHLESWFLHDCGLRTGENWRSPQD